MAGPRQVGKSTAVKKFLENYTHNSIYIALDNPGKLGEEIIRFHWNEIQNVPNWAPVIKELYDEDRDKRELSVLLLGSSALDLLLRGSESLLGRYEELLKDQSNLERCQLFVRESIIEYRIV